MTKIGTYVTDPKAGGYCRITLDSGQKIIVNHAEGGFKGGPLTIEEVKWMGLGTGARIFACDLDGPAGKELLARLTRNAAAGTADATPLGAFVNYIKDCRSIDEIKTKLTGLR